MRLRNKLTGAVVSVGDERGKALLRSGWESLDAPERSEPKPKQSSKKK